MSQPNLAVLAAKALEYVADGMVVGLGSGRASTMFIESLGQRVKQGLHVRGVPTSQASADLARKLGIPLVSLDEVACIDLAIDGADEVDPQGNCIKGYGGALVREKVVAAASKQLTILVGSEKIVERLGQRGKLPVEVIPFAASFCRRKLEHIGLCPQVREKDGSTYVTDNGNWILDCGTGPIVDLHALERNLHDIPGVVGTGLFIGMVNRVLVEREGRVEVRDY